MWAKLDLKDAFYQIPLAPVARPIFKITTPFGYYQPTIMLQGYNNAPSIFQMRLIIALGQFLILPMHILMTLFVVQKSKKVKVKRMFC